jgi:hypothetical protein
MKSSEYGHSSACRYAGAKVSPRTYEANDDIALTHREACQSGLGNRWFGLHATTARLQPTLRIGQPNDEYEQEADCVAEQVMRMPEPGIQRKPG